ncbi:MAG: hypothetical protein OEZ47_16255 [Gammaproteobacteria bacterium]|nr:hypothetical protein [Gammaproteobacteria bacterium]
MSVRQIGVGSKRVIVENVTPKKVNYAIIVISLSVTLGMSYLSYLEGGSFFLYFLAFFVLMVCVLIVSHNEILKRYIESQHLRLYISFALLGIPVFSFTHGKVISMNIKTGVEYQLVEVFANDQLKYYKDKELRYLGNLSGNVFSIISESGKVVSISDDQIARMEFEFIQFKKKHNN